MDGVAVETPEKDASESKGVEDKPSNPVATLLTGLGSSDEEANSVASVFWSEAWPKLQESGWAKLTKPDAANSRGKTIVATRKDLDFETCQMGEDYYVCIKDVVDRINERRNSYESSAADLYGRAISKLADNKQAYPNFERSSRHKRRKVEEWAAPHSKPPSKSPIKADLSWKNAGEDIFPKKSSSVGKEYQATDIPEAGSFYSNDNPSSDTFCELIWDPSAAARKGIVLEDGKDVVSGVRHNFREQALVGLSLVDYNAEAFESSVTAGLQPWDGSNWTPEQRDQFHSEIFRTRRDVPAVAKLMNLPVKICHAYYLGIYKNSNDYRLLKTVGKEEREIKEEEQDTCCVCGDGGKLIICDGCDGEYHLTCLQPALARVPEGYWECDDCVDRRLLKAREDLLRNSALFELVVDDKPKAAQPNSNHAGAQKPVYRPVPDVLQAVRAMALAIGEVLHKHTERT